MNKLSIGLMTGLSRNHYVLILLFVAIWKGIQCRKRYTTDIERFEWCKEYPILANTIKNMRFDKINRTTRAYSLESNLQVPMDENVGLKGELERWTANGWTQIPFVPLQPDACKMFTKLLGNLWVDIKRNMGVKEPEKCPIPAGHYELKDYLYDTSELDKFAPFKGKFKYKMMLIDMKTKQLVQCIVLVINFTDAV